MLTSEVAIDPLRCRMAGGPGHCDRRIEVVGDAAAFNLVTVLICLDDGVWSAQVGRVWVADAADGDDVDVVGAKPTGPVCVAHEEEVSGAAGDEGSASV